MFTDEEGVGAGFQEEVDIGLETEVVRRALERLPHHEREVLELRFGIGGESQPHTLDQVVERLGISRNRVRRLEADALAGLAVLREVQGLRRFA